MTNYVSAVPLKELGLGLGVEHVGDEQAQDLTDDYSLPALKVSPALTLTAMRGEGVSPTPNPNPTHYERGGGHPPHP